MFVILQESQVLIAGGGVLLFFILGERFTLMYFGLMLNPTLPEGKSCSVKIMFFNIKKLNTMLYFQ